MWVIVLLAGFLGGWFFFEALAADSAPKQAAGAALAAATVVIPYCMSRAVQFLRGDERLKELRAINEKMDTQTKLLAAVANAATPLNE